MKTRELKSYNLMSNRSYNEALDAKPYVLLYILFFYGIGLVLFSEYVFGVAVIFFSASCILFLPQRVLIEFYDEYMIAYNKANKDECSIIYYDEVASWSYVFNVHQDFLEIVLTDSSVIKIPGYSKTAYEATMNKYLKSKRKKAK